MLQWIDVQPQRFAASNRWRPAIRIQPPPF
jgi:hypothetical protein